jgi:phenylacetic acid degradation protein paaN
MATTAGSSTTRDLLERHRPTLRWAVQAIGDRGYWTPYPEQAGAYPEGSAEQGREAVRARLHHRFPLDQPGTVGWVGSERSPYGFELGITYPSADPDRLLAAMRASMPAWREAGPELRACICLEVLARLNARSHEIAEAVTHTTGQAPGMAFQAGGPHAQDRGLEAVAYAYRSMAQVPDSAQWEKPQGKRPPLRMTKRFHVVPRGLALVVGCTTFPTWNGYPGLFASLATGNPVLVKPHPGAILPLALTVLVAREVLEEAGLDPNVVCLAAENPGDGIAAGLARRPEVRIVDFTGSPVFGRWLKENAGHADVYAEMAGVNTVVIDSTDDYAGMLGNLAFSLCLYSGQMCTTPQNLLVPASGIATEQGHRSFDQVAGDLAAAVARLLDDPARACAILGAIVNADVMARLERAPDLGPLVMESRALRHPDFPEATVRTPALVRLTAGDRATYGSECFGPVSFLIATAGTGESLEVWRSTLEERGALTASVYSTDAAVRERAQEIAVAGGVHLSLNLTGGVYVNQSAAFSDFHATGATPAATESLTDDAFVCRRFHVVQTRWHSPAADALPPG